MKLNKKDISEFASDLLGFIKKENIFNPSDLDFKADKKYYFGLRPNSYIGVVVRPNIELCRYNISYISQGIGIPLEIKINTDYDFSLILIKSIDDFKRYEKFALDRFGNRLQEKKILTTNFSHINKELENLVLVRN